MDEKWRNVLIYMLSVMIIVTFAILIGVATLAVVAVVRSNTYYLIKCFAVGIYVIAFIEVFKSRFGGGS